MGAVRNKGLIPWDDDIDVCMLRDDYAKFKEVAKNEFGGKYYYQDWYNSCGRTWIFSKLRNSETTAIEYPEKPKEFNQGIFIDIFSIDGGGGLEQMKYCKSRKSNSNLSEEFMEVPLRRMLLEKQK